MRSKSALISIAVVCLVLGIMLSVQYKTGEFYGNKLTSERVEDLAIKLTTAMEERDALAVEVISLREKLSNVRDTDKAMADLQAELKKANMTAGMVLIHGPGVIVTLNDSLLNVPAGDDVNPYLIHDVDLLTVINELKSSDAEAISVNGERIMAMSEIRCAGTTILVNWKKMAPPYKIKAIGNPEVMESGLIIKGGYLEQLKLLGIQVQIQKSDDVEVSAYNGPLKFVYSSAVKPQEKAE